MELSRLKYVLFLMKEEKTPCPHCKQKKMQFNPNGSSGYDFACIFTCLNCKTNKQEDCCLFYAENIRVRRFPLVKYGIFQLLNGRNPEYKL